MILYKLSQNFTLSFFALKFSLLFRFVFASFHFFASKRKKFASISLRSENYGSFSLPFWFISLRSEKDGSFCFLFTSFRFEAKMMAVFCFFSFCFRFFPFSFRFRFLRFASMRNKRKKHFFRIEAKNFASVSLHFASKRKWRRTLVRSVYLDSRSVTV